MRVPSRKLPSFFGYPPAHFFNFRLPPPQSPQTLINGVPMGQYPSYEKRHSVVRKLGLNAKPKFSFGISLFIDATKVINLQNDS